MDYDKLKQEIHDYFENLTDEQFELDKRKCNWEFYNSKMFQGIKIFSDEDDSDPVIHEIGEECVIGHIYDSDGNITETDVVYVFTESGWMRKCDII